MPIKTQKRIYRKNLQDNPEIYYVFGDNVAKEGFGGQAKEMRGEPNAIGIPTKWTPTMDGFAFFYDEQKTKFWPHIRKSLNRIRTLLEHGEIVVFPEDGIGTGLSRMNETAPEMFTILQECFNHWKASFGTLDGE